MPFSITATPQRPDAPHFQDSDKAKTRRNPPQVPRSSKPKAPVKSKHWFTRTCIFAFLQHGVYLYEWFLANFKDVHMIVLFLFITTA